MAKSRPGGKSKRNIASDALQASYSLERPRAERLLECVRNEVAALLDQANVALGVPMEGRVKDWDSISDKIDRKALNLETVAALQDLVGLRLILLFRRDLELLDKIIRSNFEVVSVEDVAERLKESQFGYQSQHYIVSLKPNWLSVPRYKDLGSLSVEIQVRTLAQHMWAAASHKLQYKREESVPMPVRRAIYRVSALLETVDLELDRVVSQRDSYINAVETTQMPDADLNVDLIRLIAKEILPENNYVEGLEDFDHALRELESFQITTAGGLRDLLTGQLKEVMAHDEKIALGQKEQGNNNERVLKGGFYTHAGLVRLAMMKKFGTDAYIDKRRELGSLPS